MTHDCMCYARGALDTRADKLLDDGSTRRSTQELFDLLGTDPKSSWAAGQLGLRALRPPVRWADELSDRFVGPAL